MKQIVAMGGGGFMMEPENPRLDDFILQLARGNESRVCFIATGSGDSDRNIVSFYNHLGPRCRPTHLPLFNRRKDEDLEAMLLRQDVIYVSGGNTLNLLAVWRIHGVDLALRKAYDAGIVLAGVSAGALCWFEGGITDSLGNLSPFHGGLGLLEGTMCPHYDGEALRQPLYRALVEGSGVSGYAADDYAALHFVDGALREVVSSRPGALGYRVAKGAGGVLRATPLATRYLELR